MRWTVHGERSLYESPWVGLSLADVEVPGGARFDHHVIRAPRAAAGTVVVDDAAGVLLLWRHRFITDTWGWEIPAGGIDDGEESEAAARREALEETGWEISELSPLITYHPTNGISDQRFELFLARHAVHRGDPLDPSESERVEWVAAAEVRRAMLDGEIHDGLSLTALAIAFTAGHLDTT